MIRLIAIAIVAQSSIPKISLDHWSAPRTQHIQSTHECDGKVFNVDFIANSVGVKLRKPVLSRASRNDRKMVAGIESLGDLGNLKSWRVSCLGSSPTLIFHGFRSVDGRDEIVTIDSDNGVILGFGDHDPAM